MTKLLSVKDVAKRLNIGKQSAWQYIKDGKIKSIKLIRAYRIREEDLEKFIKDSNYST